MLSYYKSNNAPKVYIILTSFCLHLPKIQCRIRYLVNSSMKCHLQIKQSTIWLWWNANKKKSLVKQKSKIEYTMNKIIRFWNLLIKVFEKSLLREQKQCLENQEVSFKANQILIQSGC